jgi:DNA-binding transcriptional MocR family regulator
MGATMTAPPGEPRITARALAALLGAWSIRGGPLYRLLADSIARLADIGKLPAGVLLPPERALAEAVMVSRNTATSAYQILRDEGIAETRHGSGTRMTAHRTTPAAVHRADAFFAGLLESATIEVDLSLAVPDCAPAVAAALDDPRSVLDAEARRAVTEGSGYHLYGLPMFRAVLAEHVGGRYQVPTEVGQVLVTTGAQQAIDLLIRGLVLPGQSVVVEDPTFPGVLDAIHRAGARAIRLPAEHGIDPERLAWIVETHRPALIYLMLTHSNPTGRVVAEALRPAIVEIAVAHPDTVVVEDLALAELALGPERRFGPEPWDVYGDPLQLAAFAPQLPNLVSVGSLSKVYWGGLRVGWIRAAPGMVRRLAAVRAVADLGAPTLTQAIAGALIVDSHKEILRWRVEQLRVRRDALVAAVRALLPTWSVDVPAGGLSLWVNLRGGGGATPDRGGGKEFARAALERGVAVVPGHLFSVTDHHHSALRIAYARPVAELDEGVRRLAEVWGELG